MAILRCNCPADAEDLRKILRRKTNFASGFNLIWPVQPLREKYSASVFQKTMIVSAHPASTRGAYRDRHGRWKRDAVAVRMFSAFCAPTTASWRTAKSCGPDPPTLGSSL
jgi:hypothetical protein